MSDSELRVQKEAACACILRTKWPLQWVIYTGFPHFCNNVLLWKVISTYIVTIKWPTQYAFTWSSTYFKKYTVQIPHNLNSTHVSHACHTCITCVSHVYHMHVCQIKKHEWHQTTHVHAYKINAPHTHTLIHTKYLPQNDPPYKTVVP